MLLDRETNQSYDNFIIMTILFRKTFRKDEISYKIRDDWRGNRWQWQLYFYFNFIIPQQICKLETHAVNFLRLIVEQEK